jgi:aminodeoxyfutalosine synthase
MDAVTPQEMLDTPDLIAVGVTGDEVRRRMHGTRTTFVRVLETHVDAPLTTLPPGSQFKEIRIIGTPSSLDAAVKAVGSATALAGGVPVTGFSVAELLPLGAPAETARALAAAGLSAIAHLPIDLVEGAADAARGFAGGGLTVNTITIHELTDEARLDLCVRARELQAAVGSFKAFAPLPRTISITKPTTGYDDVKMVALARTVVENVRSIQVDWQLYGPKMAQVALTVGADDVDNVSAADGGALGTRRSPLEEIKGNIKAAGLEPVERDGRFLVNFQTPTPNSQTPTLNSQRPTANSQTDADG